ncbi:MAG TPA: phosphatase [Mycobacteriales bacterium]|nr:phosphatase [Mycobacteriales bacterium]
MTTVTQTPTRDQLRAHLVSSRIAGDVATTRQNNLENFGKMSRRDPLYLFGLLPTGRWSYEDVLALMASRCGVVADPEHVHGQDTIDPDRTVERLDAMADRLRLAAERQERVIVATGHPVGLRPTHTAVAHGLAAAGCTLLTPAGGWRHPDVAELGDHSGTLDWVDSVGVLRSPWGNLKHTHSPLLMQAALDTLETPPDLVVADHGWAGAAGQAGIDTVGYADCNDPALFVGEAEGKVLSCVPLDDNVDPRLYLPLTAYLLDRAGLSA